jgi:hypothetical protein
VLKPIILLALFLPAVAEAQSRLTGRDSSQLAIQVASDLRAKLRSNAGATPANSVCVAFTSQVGGAFRRTLDSALYAFSGGPLVAPVKIGPMRKIEIVRIEQFESRALVVYRTSGGGMRRGDRIWGNTMQEAFVRRGDGWSRSRLGSVVVSDGQLATDSPVTRVPPRC